MRDFWTRYQQRELTEKDNEKIFWLLFIPYVMGALLGDCLVDGEVGDRANVVFYWALTAFFLPWLAVVRLIQAHTLPRFPSIRRRVALFVVAVIYASVAATAGFGYMDVANALTGSASHAMVSGPVVSMKSYSGGWSGRQRLITIHFENRDLDLTLTQEDYSNVRIGDIYSREMKLGGLGYYYKWGRAYWK